jgi:alpha-1,3-rhamnosyl/mannosyltransferase
MRVAIDTNGLYTGQGGTARHIRGFLHGLQTSSAKIDFFPFAWPVRNLAYQQPGRALKTAYRELIWANTVAPWKLARSRADLYHVMGSDFVSSPKRLKRIVTLYDLAVVRHPERFRKWHRWSDARRLKRLASAARILCISRFTAEEAMALLGIPSRQLEVIYCGCDFHPTERPPAEEQPAFEVPPEYFLFVGSLEPGKNLSLLRATYELAATRGQVLPPLLVMGVRWAGVGTEGKPPPGWTYLGRQSDEVLQYLYRRALALVFPSKYEGFGLPVAEAMALGCPVICSQVASIPEVGGEAACYADLRPEAYFDAMVRLCRDHALREDLITKGREQSRRFSWSKCAEETVRVYREVCRPA